MRIDTKNNRTEFRCSLWRQYPEDLFFLNNFLDLKNEKYMNPRTQSETILIKDE